jgi:hypothetical protein
MALQRAPQRAGRSAVPPAGFPVFLGNKASAVALLQALRGNWRDLAHPRLYTVTPKGESANVLTDHLCSGEEQRGVGLVSVRKIQDVYCILWSETFCLSKASSACSVTWLPLDERKHRVYRWAR